MPPHDPDVTQLLAEAADGDATALDRLLPLVYPEMRTLAERHLRGERADHTLDPVALASEAYLKLARQDHAAWQNRTHFLAVAGLAMRNILVSYARARKADKRGGGVRAVTLVEGTVERAAQTDQLIALDEALTRLASVNPRGARVVELWFFGGLTQAEIGRALGVSEATVRRDWRIARAYLTAALGDELLPGA